jgi:hypothetical protein
MVAQMAYTTESAPQSTINHNAVIEVASDLGWPHAIAADAAGAQKAGSPCPKGRPQIGRDHAKIAPPAQRRGGHKSAIFGRFFASRRMFSFDF